MSQLAIAEFVVFVLFDLYFQGQKSAGKSFHSYLTLALSIYDTTKASARQATTEMANRYLTTDEGKYFFFTAQNA